jgi:hypothetical protein
MFVFILALQLAGTPIRPSPQPGDRTCNAQGMCTTVVKPLSADEFCKGNENPEACKAAYLSQGSMYKNPGQRRAKRREGR